MVIDLCKKNVNLFCYFRYSIYLCIRFKQQNLFIMTYRISHPVFGSIFVDEREFDQCVKEAEKLSVDYTINEDKYSKILIV